MRQLLRDDSQALLADGASALLAIAALIGVHPYQCSRSLRFRSAILGQASATRRDDLQAGCRS
jgi:hypothetical protein